MKNLLLFTDLRTCCADRMLNWASEQKSHRRRRFSWIFACCCERVNSNKNLKKRLFVFLLVEKIDKEWYTIK
jgi:hypothetical protein